MPSPLYDRELDALPPPVAPQATRKEISGRKKLDPRVRWGLYSYPVAFDLPFVGVWIHALLLMAAFAPRASLKLVSDRRVGAILLFLSAFFVVWPIVTVGELLPTFRQSPYLGALFLLAASAQAASYLRGMRGRLLRFTSDPQGKGASTFTLVLAAFGFIGGTIPRSLRVLVVYGLIAGVVFTVMNVLSITENFAAPPGDEGTRVQLWGEGVVRGNIDWIESGPVTFADGDGGDRPFGAEGSRISGGTIKQDPRRKGWAHVMTGGTVRGHSLIVEMKGRGIALQGRGALRAWTFVRVAFLLTGLILVAACLTAANGRPIGFVLYLTWAIANLGYGVLLWVWGPNGRGLDVWAVHVGAAVVVLAILRQPPVRTYLGRPTPSLHDDGPSRRMVCPGAVKELG